MNAKQSPLCSLERTRRARTDAQRTETFAHVEALREQTQRRQQEGFETHERARDLLAVVARVQRRMRAT
jgi:hypothetical protein